MRRLEEGLYREVLEEDKNGILVSKGKILK